MGSDPDDVLQPDEEEKVSIHAPTWGATQHQGYQNGWEQFQSTLPHGERQHYDKYSLW